MNVPETPRSPLLYYTYQHPASRLGEQRRGGGPIFDPADENLRRRRKIPQSGSHKAVGAPTGL